MESFAVGRAGERRRRAAGEQSRWTRGEQGRWFFARRSAGDHVRRAEDDAGQRYADWSRIQEGLTRFVAETWSFRGLAAGSGSGGAIAVLRGDERAFVALAGAHLIEPRPSGGRFVGGTPGVWLRLVDGVRAEVGGSGGLFLPGSDQPTSVDVGGLVITDRRAVLLGREREHEWLFRNLLAVHHDPDAPWTALPVSNEPTVSGFLYGHADVAFVRFRFTLALAVSTGTVGRLRAELQESLRLHLDGKPPFP